MNIAYFRWQESDGVIDITFQLNIDVPTVNKSFNFKRPVSELVDITLNRMKTNVDKEIQKRSKVKSVKTKKTKKVEADQSKQPEAEGEGSAEENIQNLKVLLVNSTGEPITGITWTDLFVTTPELSKNAILRIKIFDYALAFNYPHVGRVDMPTSIMVGFDCYSTKLEFQFTTRAECEYKWYKGLPKPNHENAVKDIKWTQCGDEFIYKPKTEDLGHKLKLECIPRRENLIGAPLEAIAKCIVEAGPGFDAFKDKHAFTPSRLEAAGKQFRVVSYNILADYYADSDFTRTELFPYCPAHALTIDYRKQLFLREIRGYNADIICMQEVDAKIFDVDFTIMLGNDGFHGLFQKKGDTLEGLATFYHQEKFSLERQFGFNLADTLETSPCFVSVYKKIEKNKKLRERMLSLSTALQVTLLKSKIHDKYILIANTHLYFHPDADHIRLLQIGLFMLYIKHIRTELETELNISNDKLSLIFCGDFNSVPECGIYKLMTEQFVPDNFVDFKSNREQAVNNVCLTQPFNMSSAYNTPKYTNYTAGFKECLDYIFYESDRLHVTQAVPLPSEEELSSLVAIPSIYFPSDHVSLIADLEWQ